MEETKDVKPVAQANWIQQYPPEFWKCSECGMAIFSRTEANIRKYHRFCGRCGAKMYSTESKF